MCVFVSRPMKIATFHRKNGETPKRVFDFPLESDTFRHKIMEIVEDFDETNYNNNGKSWKPSRILRVKPNLFFFHRSSFSVILSLCEKKFHIFIVFIFSVFFRFFFFQFFLNFSFFHVLQFLQCLLTDFLVILLIGLLMLII